MPKIRFGNYSVVLPRNRIVRITIGVVLILAGLIGGFLPILGYWMVPLGFIVLAADIPAVRRINRRVAVAVKRWWTGAKRRARSESI